MMKGVVTDGAGTPLSEYAVGPTPAYSLSKALLNTHTRLWHRQLISEGLLKSVRVMSVCPGNFQSPLSQPGTQLCLSTYRHVLNDSFINFLNTMFTNHRGAGEFFTSGRSSEACARSGSGGRRGGSILSVWSDY